MRAGERCILDNGIYFSWKIGRMEAFQSGLLVSERRQDTTLTVSPLRKSYPLKTPDMPAILIPFTMTDPAAPRK